MWWSAGSGRIELNISLKDAKSASHPGPCDADVRWLIENRVRLSNQLDKIPSDVLRDELREYGAWSVDELRDREQNLHRLVWIACGDIAEEDRPNLHTFYLWRYGGATKRRSYKHCANDTIIATVRAENTDDAYDLFQLRDPKVKRKDGSV
jgi:hypothetical protein